MEEVDPAFIQAPEHRPKPETIEAENIPLIDLSQSNSLENLVAEIGDACKNWGFFQVINHGVPLQIQDKIFKVSREFFALSKEEKKKVGRIGENPVGYYDIEHTKNVRDWKEVCDFVAQEPKLIPASPEPDDHEVKEILNQWPQNPPEMKEVCLQYAAEMEKLAFKLLQLISLSLGLEKDRLNSFFKNRTTFIRLNFYPPCPISDLALGVGRHKDGGALTILAQDEVGGLQVRRKSDGEWILVKPTPHAYIINVGDIMQVWSNDVYESVEHRVQVNPEKERFSVPCFINPGEPYGTMIEPLKELVDEHNPANYKAYSWGKLLAHRRLTNFKKFEAENIQINHFKKYSPSGT